MDAVMVRVRCALNQARAPRSFAGMQSEDIDACALVSRLEAITISDKARHPQLSEPRLPKVGEDQPARLVPPGLRPGRAPGRALDRLPVRPQRIVIARGEGPTSRRQEYPGIVI